MVMAMRVAGSEEGGDSKGHGIGNKGGVQRREQRHWRQERWQQGCRVSESNEGNDDGNISNVDDGDGDKAGEQGRGKGQVQQGRWQLQ
jgi:hypothetical protein